MCLLPLNIVNEKIYLVLWWWYIVLAVCSALAVIYRTACFMFPEFRVFMLWKPHNNWTMVANICRNRPVSEKIFDIFHFICYNYNYNLFSTVTGSCSDRW